MKKLLLFAIIVTQIRIASSQTFSFSQQTIFDQNFQTSPANLDDGLIFDYDSDGDQDYLVHFGSDGDQLKVFINDGTTFSSSVVFYDQFQSRSKTFSGDYDNDGDIDIASVGTINGQSGLFIFENQGGGAFAEPILTTATTASQGDYDKDGLIDFFIFFNDAQGGGSNLLDKKPRQFPI